MHLCIFDTDLPSWGIPLSEAYESEPEAPLSPVHAPEDLEYIAPPDDDIAQEDPEMDHVDYAVDDKEEGSSNDDDEEDEEHLAPADSALPIHDYVPSAEKTCPFDNDEPQPPMAASIKTLIAEYASTLTPPSPPPSPLSPLSSPLPLIPSPSLLLPSPTAAAARQPGISLSRGTKIMTALKEVKEDMTNLSSRQRLNSEEFHTHHQDAQDERALLQAQVSTLRRERRYHRHMAKLAESEARKMAPKKTHMTDAAIKQLIAQGVADALADYEANRDSGNGDDSHNSR
nr:hypothetical protein [Tanacetum cinerariifolium]